MGKGRTRQRLWRIALPSYRLIPAHEGGRGVLFLLGREGELEREAAGVGESCGDGGKSGGLGGLKLLEKVAMPADNWLLVFGVGEDK